MGYPSHYPTMKTKTLRIFVALTALCFTAFSLRAQEVLKTEGSSWDFLLYRTPAGTPLDPAEFDLDFHTTWHTASAYDGPPFTTGNGYFGYGPIDGKTITTNIWNSTGLLPTNEPPSGARHTTYFRSTFTPTQPVQFIRFSGIIDDGAVIYLDGVELTRIGMPEPAASFPDTWLLSSATTGSETVIATAEESVTLPAGVPVEVAVSVHNRAPDSSDMGFDLLIESLVPVPSSNDAFADAITLSGNAPIATAGDSTDGIGGSGATKETGEPNHAGDAGGSSVWWKWTPDTDGRVSVTTAGSGFDTLLAVYTGAAVNALTPVVRYPNLAIPASSANEPFHPNSYVEFDAIGGTTYYIAVDGAAGAFGSIALSIAPNFTFLDPVEELLPAGSSWSYLLLTELQGLVNQPIDPETLDADFDSTWHTAAAYDGPAFSGPSPALLGYGLIDGDPVVTDIWGGLDATGDGLPNTEPPLNFRFTNYFRASFTPANPVTHVGFEGLIDDGAIIYLNGAEVARINVDDNADANNWQTLALGSLHNTVLVNDVSNEASPQVGFALNANLPAGVPVEVAVSLHNAGASSSDQGFDLRIYSVNLPPDPPAPILINLDVAVDPANPDGIILTWNSIPGQTYTVEFSSDLQTWLPLSAVEQGDPSGTNTFSDTPPAGPPFVGFYRVSQN